MTTAAMSSTFRAAFDTFLGDRADAARRTRAMERFDALGLPTTRWEDWRFTNLAPLAETSFEPAAPGAALDAARAEALQTAPGLVFVDGHYAPSLSRVPAGVEVGPLGAAGGAGLASDEKRPFVALNDAFREDGVLLRVGKNRKLDAPLHVLFVGTDKMAHPRNVYRLEEGAEATVVETFASAGDGPHLTNVVTEVSVAANASFSHYKLQCEAESAFHVNTLFVHQGRDSRFTSHTISLGGRLTRNDIVAALDAEGIVSTLNGLVFARGRQHVDNHTWIEHRKPHSESHELYKGIYDDASSGVFSGYIHVFPDAQKTDAYQSSSNLLLSDKATIDSQPQLEIYADDVKCSHGSTIGQIDGDAIFYLRSRGLSEGAAREMLVRAFAHDVADRIEDAATRTRVEALLAERLPGGAG